MKMNVLRYSPRHVPFAPTHWLSTSQCTDHTTRGGLVRDERYHKLTSKDISTLSSFVGTGGALTDPSDLKGLNTDWLHKYTGASQLALRPTTTAQVSNILKYCNERNIAVVPQGGNTGLVGGSVPVFDEVILSTSRMNNIISFDHQEGILVAEAGCILETLEKHVEEYGCTMPLDLGAKGSCQIGGNIATNAGGIHFVAHGSLHANVLGLEVVLADGTILDSLSTLRKDNTGYDLKHLFIGSEGTLGVVTKIAMITPRKPRFKKVAYLGVSSYAKVQQVMNEAKQSLGKHLNAVEFQDRQAFQVVVEEQSNLSDPFGEEVFPFYMLVEIGANESEQETENQLNKFLINMIEHEIVEDCVIAQDETQAYKLWCLREGVAESLSKRGAVYKYDVSLPVEQMYALVETMRERVAKVGIPSEHVSGYGHIGDGNLHLNIYCNEYTKEIKDTIEPFVYEEVEKHRGSISAEHGLGLMKWSHVKYSKSPPLIEKMKQLKAVFDPNAILNPYKVGSA